MKNTLFLHSRFSQRRVVVDDSLFRNFFNAGGTADPRFPQNVLRIRKTRFLSALATERDLFILSTNFLEKSAPLLFKNSCVSVHPWIKEKEEIFFRFKIFYSHKAETNCSEMSSGVENSQKRRISKSWSLVFWDILWTVSGVGNERRRFSLKSSLSLSLQ